MLKLTIPKFKDNPLLTNNYNCSLFIEWVHEKKVNVIVSVVVVVVVVDDEVHYVGLLKTLHWQQRRGAARPI